MLRKVNLNTCIGKAWGLIDDETGATFWPTNVGACFNATNARFRVAGVDLATLYASAGNDYMLIAKDTAGKAAKGYIDLADSAEALGADVIVNGTFAADSDWNKGTGWTIAGGVADCDGTQEAVSSLRTTVGPLLAAGKLFKVTHDLTRAAGSISVGLGSEGDLTTQNSSGTYTEYGVVSANTHLYFFADADFVGTVDNVVAQEVTNVGADGVLIMSTKGGSTQSWALQETGIDLNDIATFEVLIAK